MSQPDAKAQIPCPCPGSSFLSFTSFAMPPETMPPSYSSLTDDFEDAKIGEDDEAEKLIIGLVSICSHLRQSKTIRR